MLIEAVEPGAVIDSDVCVVGGGAVGLGLAHLLEGSGLAVAVLEGGGREYEESSQMLYAGVAEGTVLPPRSAYLVTTRLRYLGGSTNHWQGWCRPLDALDYEVRSWVPDSGWPLDAETVQRYEPQAAALAEVEPFERRAPDEEARPDGVVPAESGFERTLFHISPPTKFSERYGPGLEASRDCRLLLHANVREIVTDPAGRRVEHVEVVGGDGQAYRVRAGRFVLAAGAVENARLLLASNGNEPGGVGNRNDLVGRYFMDHPFLNAAFAVFPRRRRVMQIFRTGQRVRSGHRVRAVLRPSDRLQRDEELLNSVCVLELVNPHEVSELTRSVKWLAEDVAGMTGWPRSEDRNPAYLAFVRVASEQIPSADSRVTLDTERDALGMPRARLDWRLGEADASSVRRTMEQLARGLGTTLRGRVRLLVDEERPWPDATGSNHHMGTTRMDDDPARGVVDSECRVHGLENLYVGGSSVFPTVGASNPTLALLALTARLAEHLRTGRAA